MIAELLSQRFGIPSGVDCVISVCEIGKQQVFQVANPLARYVDVAPSVVPKCGEISDGRFVVSPECAG